MAAVSAPHAPIGVLYAVLGVLSTTDTWRGQPVVDTLEGILEATDPEDARYIPEALGECVVALRGDPERCVLALDIIRAFDLFEATGGVARLLRESPFEEAVMTGAVMATHPCADHVLGDVVEMVARGVAESADPRFLERVRAVKDGEALEGASDATRLLLRERWPGFFSLDEAAGPLVVLTDDVGAPADGFSFLAELRRVGVHVRRIPMEVKTVPPGWLPNWGAVITGEERPPWWPKEHMTLKTHGSLSLSSRRTLVRRLARALKGRMKLRVPQLTQPVQRIVDPLLDASAFFEGALKVPEVAFMTGWATSTLRSRGRDHSELRPRSSPHRARLGYYDFAQVTAMRVDHYISTKFGRRPNPELAVSLVREARSHNAVPTHITGSGDVLFEYDEILADPSGQGAFPAVALDDVVRTFDLGSGETVPELLHPSEHTEVHPSVQRGTPVVRGSRVSALAVRDLMAALRPAGLSGDELLEEAGVYYPELSGPQLIDADGIGYQIIA